jgi:hypothetical protein
MMERMLQTGEPDGDPSAGNAGCKNCALADPSFGPANSGPAIHDIKKNMKDAKSPLFKVPCF